MSSAGVIAELPAVPMIGISAYCEQARWGVWDVDAVVLPRRYADRVAQAGAIPVLLPPMAGVEDALSRLDGLVLSGGGDIDPARYGAKPGPHTTSVRAERDAAELALLQAALSRGLPVLGICRGMQLINVALGGSLHQHLPDVVGTEEHAPKAGAFADHDVTIAPGSRLAAIIGAAGPERPVPVPTHHHQGIDRLAAGLTAMAWTPDGIVEAVALDPGRSPFVLAVQWHPEAGEDLSLFRALVTAAAGSTLAAGRQPAAHGAAMVPA
jgi:putative glutamine amidotransferase